MEMGPSEFVEPRKKSALLDEGYTGVPKTRDFDEILIRYSENPNFWYFLRSTAF